ncbi:hypothetical protein ABTY61_38450 [Kitasatospora sp. NPDC096128]|uniref:hypothetical protein n=1 Tax=Kitasatospora sp. NPDC096128 TaxID=3155547 RepID=UPI0033301E08
MTTFELTPPEAARWAARAGLVLPAERHAAVAAVADHIHGVVAVLRELDFADVPPAAAYRPTRHAAHPAGQGPHDAAV